MLYNSARTAIKRNRVSVPTRYFLSNSLIHGKVLHHGCGKAQIDTRAMQGVADVVEYDPTFVPNERALEFTYDVVVCNYVLNVLLPLDAVNAIRVLRKVTSEKGYALIAVRGKGDGISGQPIEDGFITKRGTFQRPFTIDILKEYLYTFFEDVEILSGTNKSSYILAKVY
jgi:hypothetical protein